MPLILAIEPDATQAAVLAALVRRHLDAELVMEASAAAALAALGSRVPDLILTPALLGLRDEAALTERFRDMGAAAAHVQMLAVPILASAAPRSGGMGGLLGRKRDRQERAETVGCDPAVFAEQIGIYLRRAAVEQEAQAAAVALKPPPAENPHDPTEIDVAAQGQESLLTTTPAPDLGETSDVTAAPGIVEPAEAADEPPPLGRADSAPAADPRAPELLVPPRPRSAEEPSPPAAAVRAMEAELGLTVPAAASPPLWRVSAGIEDFYNGGDTFAPGAPPAAAASDEASVLPGAGTWTGGEDPVPEAAAVPDNDPFLELELDDVLDAAVSEPTDAGPEVSVTSSSGVITPGAAAVPDGVSDLDGEEAAAYAAILSAAQAEAEASGTLADSAVAGHVDPIEPLDSIVPNGPIIPADPIDPIVVAIDPFGPGEPEEPIDAVEPIASAPEPIAARAQRPRRAAPAPPLDDWAYFDPSQSPFKALVRRLDEIAGYAGAER